MERSAIDAAIATADLGAVTWLLRRHRPSGPAIGAAGGLSGLLPTQGSVARLISKDVKVRWPFCAP